MTMLPLFPLPIAVCPTELVPLHIFEERYQAMMRDVLAEGEGAPRPFIISYAQAGGFAPVGTVVRLVRVLMRYDDGRMDIIVRGVRRCVVSEVESDRLYRMAEAIPGDDRVADWSEELANESYNLHRALIRMITGRQPDEARYAGVAQLSFTLAASLGLEHRAKQDLLELDSEDDRLRLLIEFMQDMVTRIERVQLTARAVQGYSELEDICRSAGKEDRRDG